MLERLARGRFPSGLAVTLVTPRRHHAYSGMVPGLVGGRYRTEDLLIDLAALARAAGAEYREGSVRRIDPGPRRVTLADGTPLGYDLLSFAIGSGNAGADRPGVREAAVFVKPIDRVVGLVPAVERLAAEAARGRARVAVVGGGAAGVELALNLRARLRLLRRDDASVSVIEGGPGILRDRSAACRRAAEAALARHRIETLVGSDVARIDGARVELESGRSLRVELVVWATGPAAPDLFAGSGLATDDSGYLRVDATLRSLSHPEVFAAGDAAAVEGHPDLAKAGVYAVRQGPVLGRNLAAAAAGRAVRRRFRPRRRFLALLNTGDDRAILSYGDLAATGRWAMALKDRIDRRFVARFRR